MTWVTIEISFVSLLYASPNRLVDDSDDDEGHGVRSTQSPDSTRQTGSISWMELHIPNHVSEKLDFCVFGFCFNLHYSYLSHHLTKTRTMTSNVLPFFWNLASSSKDTRLSASADLISSLESFQQSYQATRTGEEGDGSVDEEDEDEDSDEESGTEVDGSEDEGQGDDGQGRKLDKRLARDNAEDVTYSVKRLVRGLASSRESSRLGFAVALTEVSHSLIILVNRL